MKVFDYHEPTTVTETTSLLHTYGDDAALLAGGTSFVVLAKLGLVEPGHVLGLRRVEALRGIRLDAESLWIGALETLRDIERSPLVAQHAPALVRTIAKVATPRIRNQATIAGNIVHADPAQDPPPMLIALDAVAIVENHRGQRREAPLDGFFETYFSVALQPDEMVLGIRVPLSAPGLRCAYTKFLPRTVDDYATVSVAVAVRLGDDGVIKEARIVLGAVGPTPLRCVAVERALVGQRPAPDVLADAAELVTDEIDPIDDTRGSASYKREMARVWTRRTLQEVVG